MRRLIYIRVIHNFVESKISKKCALDKEIERFWDIVRKELEKIGLDYRKVRLYNDTVCGGQRIAMQAFRNIAKQGSPNAKTVLWLVEKGAKLMMTENPFFILFLDKHKFGNKYLSGIRKRRDKYVAGRIARTLRKGETGILIMGCNHSVDDYLPKDIKVLYLPKSDAYLARLLKKVS